MTYRIVKTTDGQHLGEVVSSVQAGNILTFADGDVVSLDKVFSSDDGSVIAVSPNYQITFIKE